MFALIHFQWHLPSEPPKKSNLRKNSIRVFPCCNFMNKRMGYNSEGKLAMWHKLTIKWESRERKYLICYLGSNVSISGWIKDTNTKESKSELQYQTSHCYSRPRILVTEMRDKTNKCHLIEKFFWGIDPASCLSTLACSNGNTSKLHVDLHMWQIKTLVIYTKHNCSMVWKRIYEKSVHITSVRAEIKEESLCIVLKV